MTATSEVAEIMARAMEPEIFAKPRINLYREDYDRAFAKARAALAALHEAGFKVLPRDPDREPAR